MNTCPIKTLLEVVRGAVSCEDTIQMSFLHKCGQFSLCSALNVEVIVTFWDISSFRFLHGSVTFPGAPLFSMANCLKYFRDASAPREPRSTCQFPFSPQSSYLCVHGSLIILGSFIILGQGPWHKNVLRSPTLTHTCVRAHTHTHIYIYITYWLLVSEQFIKLMLLAAMSGYLEIP